MKHLRIVLVAYALASMIIATAAQPAAASAMPPHSYRLLLRLDGRTARLDVEGEWRLPPTDADRSEISFRLAEFARDVEFVAARCGRTQTNVEAVRHIEEDLWTLDLSAPCRAGSALALSFRYAYEEAAAPQVRITTEDGFASSSGDLWYPQLGYLESDEIGDITIDLPSGLTSVATGRQTRATTRNGRTQTTFHVDGPTKFAFAYARYRVIRVDGAVPVEIYAQSADLDAGTIARTALRTLDPLVDAFGPAPFEVIRLVEIDFRSRVLGVSESGMVLVDISRMRAMSEADLPYWAHEIGHQWWGNLVRAQPRTPAASMLTEGVAQYGALYAIEWREGEAAAAAYRRSGRGTRQSIEGYREIVARAGRDVALASFRPANGDEYVLAHQLATSKGAIVLDLLAREIGRDRFHAALRAFLTQHAGGRTTFAAFHERIVSDAGPQARRFFDDWFARPGGPALRCRLERTTHSAHLLLEQSEPTYDLPLTLRLEGEWGSQAMHARMGAARTDITLTAPGEIDRVIVDPDNFIPFAEPVVICEQR